MEKTKDESVGNKLQISFTTDQNGSITGAMGVVRGNEPDEFTKNLAFIEGEVKKLVSSSPPQRVGIPSSIRQAMRTSYTPGKFATKIETHVCSVDCVIPMHACEICGAEAYISSHQKRDGSGSYTRLDCDNGHKFWPPKR